MALHRGIEGPDPVRSEPVGRLAGAHEKRPGRASRRLALGTLACPACDAPIAAPRPLSPAEALACGFCDHAGAVRDFLSLAGPPRPARVEVRVRA